MGVAAVAPFWSVALIDFSQLIFQKTGWQSGSGERIATARMDSQRAKEGVPGGERAGSTAGIFGGVPPGVINCVGHLRESALRRSLFLEVVGLQGVTTKLGFGKECVLDYSAISVCKARPTKRR